MATICSTATVFLTLLREQPRDSDAVFLGQTQKGNSQLVLWKDLHTAVLLILHRFDMAVTNDIPSRALFVRLTAPGESFDLLVRTGFAVSRADRYVDSGVAYVAWPAALGLLVSWTLVFVALGFLRFKTADLLTVGDSAPPVVHSRDRPRGDSWGLASRRRRSDGGDATGSETRL